MNAHKWHYRIAILLMAACFCRMVHADASYDPDTPRFILSTFRNGAETKLYITTSFDGRNYTLLTSSHVYETIDGSGIRDPSIIHHGGIWYICHTSGPTGGLGAADYFRVLSSPDLVSWTIEKNVSMAAVANTNYTWAPEWFIENDSVHVLVSVSPYITREHEIYEIHPLDPTDVSGDWSVPARLYGPAFPQFIPSIDPPGQHVGAYDPYVLKKDGVYWMFYFDKPTDYILLASAPTLLGPWAASVGGNWQGIGRYKEGQSLTHLGGTNWRFTYADAIYSKLYYLESTDDWQTWSSPVLLGSPDSLVFNHGTVVYNPDIPVFVTTIASVTPTTLQVAAPTLKQNWYQWESSTTLASDEWTVEGAAFKGDGTTTNAQFSINPTDTLFLRARWLPFGS